MSMAVGQIQRIVDEVKDKSAKYEERVKKVSAELEEVKMLKQTDYTAYYEKVQGDLFALSEKTVSLQSQNKAIER